MENDTRVCLRKGTCKGSRYAPYVVPARSERYNHNEAESFNPQTVSQMSNSPRSTATSFAAQHHPQRPFVEQFPSAAQPEPLVYAGGLHRYLKLQQSIAEIHSQQLQFSATAGAADARSFKTNKSVQDAYISMAIMLCFKSLNATLHALYTAYHMCTSPQADPAAVNAAMDHAEFLLDTTVRRLGLAQRLAELQQQALAQSAGTAAVTQINTSGATSAAEKQSESVLLESPTPDAAAASVGCYVCSTVAAGAEAEHPQQQGNLVINFQEEVGSSWE